MRDDATLARTSPSVSFITNCYEATYRKVLHAEYWARVARDLQRPVTKRVAVINNVTDRPSVERMARQLVRDGDIDEYYFVADHIECALKAMELPRSTLEQIPHYTDWALVAIHSCKTDYLIHSDADVHMLEAHDWVTPCLQRLAQQPDLLIANPLWSPDRFSLQKIRGENSEEDDDFLIGFGFSDQLFMARTRDLQQPIYEFTHPMSLRYPLAHICPIFEQRVDSYMRRAEKKRLTYKHAGYSHPKMLEGASYPCMQLKERLRRHANRATVKLYKAFTRTK